MHPILVASSVMNASKPLPDTPQFQTLCAAHVDHFPVCRLAGIAQFSHVAQDDQRLVMPA